MQFRFCIKLLQIEFDYVIIKTVNWRKNNARKNIKGEITNGEACNDWGCNTHTHTHCNLINNKRAENKAALVCVYKKRWIK